MKMDELFFVLSKRLTCDVKNSQELQRNFKLVTMFGFSAILMCSWESLLSSLSIVLTNGGTAGLIWTWAIVWLGFTAVYLSMAEVRLLTRHAMIPLSLHTFFADADVDADVAGSLRWVPWLLLREVRHLF